MGLYKDDAEAALHQRAIAALAAEEDVPEEDVRRVYEDELAGLKAGASIDTYLPTLVHRRARSRLRGRGG